MTLGERLYELRKAKHLSQESAADILGVTRQTVSKWETDQTTPDFDKILPICKLYGITSDELLTGEKSEKDETQSEPPIQETQNETASAESGSSYRENYDIPNPNERYTYYDPYANRGEAQETADRAEDIPAEFAVKQKKKFAMLLSAAICLYILSPVPFFFSGKISSEIMMTLFFVIIAVATTLIVFASVSKTRTKSKKNSAAVTKEQKLYKQITHVLSLVTLVIYLVISFLTQGWSITWILWVVYALLCEIIKLVFSMKGVEIHEE